MHQPDLWENDVSIPNFLQPLKRYVSAEIEFCIANPERVKTDPEADNLSITAAEDSTINGRILEAGAAFIEQKIEAVTIHLS